MYAVASCGPECLKEMDIRFDKLSVALEDGGQKLDCMDSGQAVSSTIFINVKSSKQVQGGKSNNFV